jgi:hypothetical protein
MGYALLPSPKIGKPWSVCPTHAEATELAERAHRKGIKGRHAEPKPRGGDGRAMRITPLSEKRRFCPSVGLSLLND